MGTEIELEKANEHQAELPTVILGQHRLVLCVGSVIAWYLWFDTTVGRAQFYHEDVLRLLIVLPFCLISDGLGLLLTLVLLVRKSGVDFLGSILGCLELLLTPGTLSSLQKLWVKWWPYNTRLACREEHTTQETPSYLWVSTDVFFPVDGCFSEEAVSESWVLLFFKLYFPFSPSCSLSLFLLIWYFLFILNLESIFYLLALNKLFF